MVMDMGRSCYTRKMKFVRGDQSQTFLATWYFAAASAKPFPGFHLFSSAVWDIVHPTPVTLGDSENFQKKWSTGRRFNRSDGTTFAGPLEDFLEGAAAPGDLPRGTGGTPVVCLKDPFGLALGGEDVPVVPDLAALRKGATDTIVSSDYAGLKKGGTTS